MIVLFQSWNEFWFILAICCILEDWPYYHVSRIMILLCFEGYELESIFETFLSDNADAHFTKSSLSKYFRATHDS